MEEPLTENTGTEALQAGRRGSALGGGGLTPLLGAEATHKQDRSPVCSPRGNGSNIVKARRHRRRQLPHHHCPPRYSW